MAITKNKYVLFQKQHPVANTIITSLVSLILGYLGTYFIDIKPSIKTIESNNVKILNKQDSSLLILNNINQKYTIECEDGIDLKVGYSKEVEGDLIKIVKNDKNVFVRGDEIYLINYITKFKPSIRLLVEEIIDMPKNGNKEVKIYISKEAAIKLGLEKELYKGVFTLKMKRINK